MNVLLAMIPAFFWGTTYAVTQSTLQDWPLPLLGALRALPAGIILLMLKPCLPKKQEWSILFRLGMVNIGIFFCLIFVMALTLPSAISAVGMVSLPVFAMIFDWVVNKRNPNKIQAFFGLLLVLLAWLLFDPRTIHLNYIGLLAMFAAIICILYGSSMTKSLGIRMHWWTVLTWQLILGGGLLTVAAVIHGFISPEKYIHVINHFQLNNAIGLSWIIILNTALGYGLYVWLLQKMSVVDFTFAGIANPIAGIATGLFLLNETFNETQYLLMGSMILTSLMPQIIASTKSYFSSTAHHAAV
jgi:drug/metabolite transporter (DMT)-like permease